MNIQIMTGALNTILNQLQFGMLIVDVRAVKLPGKVKQNLPPKYGQPIDVGGSVDVQILLFLPL
jgi:hypothetical protein